MKKRSFHIIQPESAIENFRVLCTAQNATASAIFSTKLAVTWLQEYFKSTNCTLLTVAQSETSSNPDTTIMDFATLPNQIFLFTWKVSASTVTKLHRTSKIIALWRLAE